MLPLSSADPAGITFARDAQPAWEHATTMALNSMTGFSRTEGAGEGVAWFWELRAVNGRGLDMRVRVPQGSERLDELVRKRLAQRLVRGTVSATLSVRRDTAATALRINERALADVVVAAARAKALLVDAGLAPSSTTMTLGEVLAVRGVLEASEQETTDAVREAHDAAVLASFDCALDGLVAARSEEGARLHTSVAAQVATIRHLTSEIAAAPERTPTAVRARLDQQLAKVVDASSDIDPTRLHQELALLAVRIDIDEELTRLAAHVAAAGDLLAGSGAVGRKLDFLAQEFNREANTICSKAHDREISRLGLDLKVVIDQLREQVQNVE